MRSEIPHCRNRGRGRPAAAGVLKRAAVLTAVLSILAGAGCRGAVAIPVPAKQRGVSWVAGREITAENLRPLVNDHVDWIVQTPFGWQQSCDSPHIALVTSGRGLWGERDEGLTTTAALASSLGICTLLKPHIWILRPDGKSRMDIAMGGEADWARWFASYREFILHYAELAERDHMEMLCVGTELGSAVVGREDDWRRLIADIRRVYHGRLTYAANWYREFEEVPFWDALDYVGIQAYFPLSEKGNPTVEELSAGWKPHLAAIERVAARVGKPVLFTEIGYRSVPDAAARPWEWPSRFEPDSAPSDPGLQARCYEAFFRTVWPRKWMAGAYWWKWFPDGRHHGERAATGFSPQGKPAEAVLARGYGGSIDAPGTGD